MFNRVKSVIKLRFPMVVQAYMSVRTALSDFRYRHFILPRLRRMEPESVFRWHFEKKDWAGSGAESVSGPGSTLEATKFLQRALPELIHEYGIKTMLDIPCGDGNWISQVDLGLERYI